MLSGMTTGQVVAVVWGAVAGAAVLVAGLTGSLA
jgi:hypothetical protein